MEVQYNLGARGKPCIQRKSGGEKTKRLVMGNVLCVDQLPVHPLPPAALEPGHDLPYMITGKDTKRGIAFKMPY